MKTDTKFNSILKGAAILAIPATALSIISLEFEEYQSAIGIINIVLFILFPYYWGKRYKRSLPASAFFASGKAFKYSISFIFIAMLIAQVPSFHRLITAEPTELVEENITALQKQGHEVSQEEIDVMLMTSSNKSGLIGLSFFSIILSSMLYSLIVAAFIKKRNEEVIIDDIQIDETLIVDNSQDETIVEEETTIEGDTKDDTNKEQEIK